MIPNSNDGYLTAAEADPFWEEALGAGRDAWEDSTAAPFPKGYIGLARRIVHNSGVAEMIDGWSREDREGRRGGGHTE